MRRFFASFILVALCFALLAAAWLMVVLPFLIVFGADTVRVAFTWLAAVAFASLVVFADDRWDVIDRLRAEVEW